MSVKRGAKCLQEPGKLRLSIVVSFSNAHISAHRVNTITHTTALGAIEKRKMSAFVF